MLATFVLALIPLPEPAYFTIQIEASRFSEYTIKIHGTEVKEGTYKTEPLSSHTLMEIEVTHTNGDNRVRKVFPVILSPGYHREILLRIPRVFPTVVEL